MSGKLRKHLHWIVLVCALGVLVLVPACAAPTAAPQPTAATQLTSAPQATKAPEPTKAAAPASPVEAAIAAVKDLKGAERESKLLEGAKKEAEFMLYTSINTTDAQPILDEFNKKYPGVNGKFFRASSGDLFTKALNEARGGQFLWDALDISPEYVYPLAAENIFTSYDSPIIQEIPAALRDAKGMWTSMYLNDNVITWNTKLVKPEEAPKTYEDLLDPKWKGKISLDTEDYPWAYYLIQTMGKDKAVEFMTKLAAQKPQMIKGRTNQTNQLIAGEVSVSVALYDYMEIQQQGKGAPVAFGYVEPVRLENEPIMLGKNAKHPYAAMLFLDWFLSKEGQTAMVKITNRIPVRTDVATLSDVQAKVLKGKYFLTPPKELGDNLKDMQQMFDKIFSISR